MAPKYLLLPLVLIASPTESFTAPSCVAAAKLVATNIAAVAPLRATRGDLASKEFQLEELEDREECETELWLNDDGSVTLGLTNGPAVKDYEGNWHLIETASESERPFRMRLTRTYEAGSSSSGANQVGDFTYDVKREFWGNIEMVGSSVSVSGRTHGNTKSGSGNVYVDERNLQESEVGYFTVIDSAASEGVEGEKRSSIGM